MMCCVDSQVSVTTSYTLQCPLVMHIDVHAVIINVSVYFKIITEPIYKFSSVLHVHDLCMCVCVCVCVYVV